MTIYSIFCKQIKTGLKIKSIQTNSFSLLWQLAGGVIKKWQQSLNFFCDLRIKWNDNKYTNFLYRSQIEEITVYTVLLRAKVKKLFYCIRREFGENFMTSPDHIIQIGSPIPCDIIQSRFGTLLLNIQRKEEVNGDFNQKLTFPS